MELKNDPALPGAVGGFAKRAFAVGVVLLAGSVAGGIARPDQFFRSYLLAFVFWNGLAVGSLAVLMLQYLTGGAWGIAIRRELEAATRMLWLTALAFLPLVFGMHRLYEWTHADAVAHDELLQKKTFYLNTPFFLARTAIAFAAWMLIAYFLNRWSREQDTHADHKARRPQAAAALGRRARRLRADDDVHLGRLGHVARAPLVLDDVRRDLHGQPGPRARWRSRRSPSCGSRTRRPSRSFSAAGSCTTSARCSSRSR